MFDSLTSDVLENASVFGFFGDFGIRVSSRIDYARHGRFVFDGRHSVGLDDVERSFERFDSDNM